MEVLLLEDVQNLGDKDEMVTVKDGFARNFLIPQGFAKNATASVKKMHAENLKQRSHKEAKLKTEAEDAAKELQGVSLSIGAKTSEKGSIFGSVNTIQIAEALEAQGYKLDRKKISIKGDTIKSIGKYTAKVRLHREVIIDLDFEVVSE